MRKIAIALSKGGVGKTTTAVSLAHCLALTDSRVLLIDSDTQAHCSRLLGVNPQEGLAEVLDGRDVDPHEARPNLWLLAGSQRLAGIKRTMAQKIRAGKRKLKLMMMRK